MTRLFNARDYGATGDGVTDDTPFIQAVLDAAAAQGGGEVTLGPGTYRLSPLSSGSATCLTVGNFVHFNGVGAGQTTLLLSDGVSGIDSVVQAQGNNTQVGRMSIDANAAHTGGTIAGLAITGTGWVSIDSVDVSNSSGNGFDFRNAGAGVFVTNSVARNNAGDGFAGSGLVFSSLADSLADGNGGYGFRLGGEVSVLDSEASGNARDGLYLSASAPTGTGALSPSVVGGTWHDNGGSGVHLANLQGVAGYQVNNVQAYNNAGAGILVHASQNGEISYNQVYGNQASSQIALEGASNEADSAAFANRVQWNRVVGQGAEVSAFGIAETGPGNSGNTFTDNIISQVASPLSEVAADSQMARNTPFIYSFGTLGVDHLLGQFDRDQLFAGDGNDRLEGAANDDLLTGGGGRDWLSGGTGADVFRAELLSDSYRTATQTHADVIADFNAQTDRLDLTRLGIVGLGNGHGSTVRAVYDADRDLTYLKNLDSNNAGERFELVLAGDFSHALGPQNFLPLLSGTPGNDDLHGGNGDETLLAGVGNDLLAGGAGEDRLVGGKGRDWLSGGQGADSFVYLTASDSLRSDGVNSWAHHDVITDFNGEEGDNLDVRALGFTALGDGHGTTLMVQYEAQRGTTALKSLEHNAQGNHFEVRFTGNVADALQAAGGILFSTRDAAEASTSRPSQDQTLHAATGNTALYGGAGDDRLVGSDGRNYLAGGAGDDVLSGGLGADFLAGGSGADVFRISDQAQSERGSHSVDTLNDFTLGKDLIDLRGLGFTGLGDGHNGTLAAVLAHNTGVTVLKDYDADADGARFELKLLGEYAFQLTDSDFLFGAA